MNVTAVGIKEIEFGEFKITPFQETTKVIEILVSGDIRQTRQNRYIQTINVTPEFKDGKTKASMLITTKFELDGVNLITSKPLTQDEMLFSAELLFLSIGHARSIFMNECEQEGYGSIKIPYRCFNDVFKDLQNNVYSLWN